MTISHSKGFDDRMTDKVIAEIIKALDERELVLFGPNSRQAMALRSPCPHCGKEI